MKIDDHNDESYWGSGQYIMIAFDSSLTFPLDMLYIYMLFVNEVGI